MYRKLLFDLDGTLTDPKEGICRCVQYALASFGLEEPDLDKLVLAAVNNEAYVWRGKRA